MKTTYLKKSTMILHLILLFLLFPLCLAYGQKSDKKVPGKSKLDGDMIEGVWKLTNQFWVKDGDTLMSGPDEVPNKYKMYLDGYVLMASIIPYNSKEYHGFGTYTLSDGALVEKLVSVSAQFKEEMGGNEVTYQIEMDKNYCKQSTNVPHRNTIYLSVEEWKKLD